MKKTLLITGLILVVILLGVFWLYFFMFGPQTNSGVFSTFTSDENGGPTQNTNTTVDINPITTAGAPQKLRQLTIRPVAGAAFVPGGVRYVERGTGHIYEISLPGGVEKQISGTTYPRTVSAVFSPKGNRVALTAETRVMRTTYVGTITKNDEGDSVLTGLELPQNAADISFSESGDTVRYFMRGADGGIGRSYNLTTQASETLFTTPLRDVTVVWGDPTYIYTKPAASQEGYLYEIAGNNLSHRTTGEFGLMAVPHPDGTLLSSASANGITSYFVADATERTTIPIAIFPDKCTRPVPEVVTLYCTAPTQLPAGTYPDDWYKGAVSFSDILWRIDMSTGEGEYIADLGALSARALDIMEMGHNDAGDTLYLIDKNTNTLWSYDL